jgi:predicted transcriptional regulator
MPRTIGRGRTNRLRGTKAPRAPGCTPTCKREEMDFAQEVQTWAGIHISDKLGKNGDYLLAFRDASGAALEPRLLVGNKNKDAVAESSDIRKLIRDAKERHAPVAVVVARDETQLRQVDRECRWSREDGIWILRTTRQRLRRDLDVLRPLLERMRIEGVGFPQNNAAMSEEVRRTSVLRVLERTAILKPSFSLALLFPPFVLN